ncbi:transporter substrate-binding domain-containing protein [Bacillus shivajii]|uniref:transporter substrate-binding domain-containing protein n=1 Tax=Bacillus shivajii TaxID=1983719 RepID=UPI001CFA41AF|nr:transporter substrate-binding domain-containing protein [Bacillus shivajii]UCZ52133.1 transporter substrate-binding domain-containing protein [Bacillus shivajii]
MNRLWKRALPITLGATLLLTACGESDEDASSGEDGESLFIDAGKFVYALSGEYRPFSYVDENNELTGFDVDIGKAIAEELGVEGEPYQISFSGIIPGLQDDRYDAIIGSMGITEERKESVDFSDPYYISGAQLYVRPDSDLTSIEDVDEDTNVAVALATTYEDMIQDYTTDVSTYDSDVIALQALAEGRHDAVVTDRLVGLINIEEQDLNLEMAGELIDTDYMGIAVKKGNEDLLEAINEALQAIKDNGSYLEISEHYFNEDISQE